MPESPSELMISYEPVGNKSTIALAVKIGSETLAAEKLDVLNQKARAEFVQRLSEEHPGIDPDAVKSKLVAIADERLSRNHRSEDAVDESEDPDPEALLADMPKDVRQEAEKMLSDPLLSKRVLDDVAAIGVAGERELILTVYLIGVSRLLHRCLAGIVHGQSSSGKSYTIQKTADLFPPEAVIRATQMTPQALFYMKRGSLRQRFVVAGERSLRQDDDVAEATRALREMLSEGRLSKMVPVQTRPGGPMETTLIEQEGPIAYLESTTLNKIFDEDANRVIHLYTDEQEPQTQRIIRKLATNFTGVQNNVDPERTIARHHALQRMLKPMLVVIPYADRLGDLFNSERVEARRAFPQLMLMVQASALLHQQQRLLDEQGRIVAAPEDYQLAHHLLADPMARLLGRQASKPAQRFYDRLSAWAGTDRFTTTEVIEHENASDRAVRGWLSELRDAGLIEEVEAGRGRKPTVWKQCLGQALINSEDSGVLPAPEVVFPDRDFRHSGKAQHSEYQGVLSASAEFAGKGNNRSDSVPALPASPVDAGRTCGQS